MSFAILWSGEQEAAHCQAIFLCSPDFETYRRCYKLANRRQLLDRPIIIILICETGSHHRKLLPRTIFGRKTQICPFPVCLSDLSHPPCIICVSRQYVFCKTQWGPQQQGQERPPSPQYSNRVQSACLTLLTLSGPWPAWLWWLSAGSQLGSQAIKWGQPLLFRGTHYSETICLKERLNVSVSKNWFSFCKEYTIYVLYFPEYILKSHLNLSFKAYVITSYVITIHPTFSNSFFATPSFSFLLAWVHVRDNSITQWSQLKHYLGPHNHRAAHMTYCL